MTLLITEVSGSPKRLCAPSTRLGVRCKRCDSRDNALRVSQCTLRKIAAQVSNFCPILFFNAYEYRVTQALFLCTVSPFIRAAGRNEAATPFELRGRARQMNLKERR